MRKKELSQKMWFTRTSQSAVPLTLGSTVDSTTTISGTPVASTEEVQVAAAPTDSDSGVPFNPVAGILTALAEATQRQQQQAYNHVRHLQQPDSLFQNLTPVASNPMLLTSNERTNLMAATTQNQDQMPTVNLIATPPNQSANARSMPDENQVPVASVNFLPARGALPFGNLAPSIHHNQLQQQQTADVMMQDHQSQSSNASLASSHRVASVLDTRHHADNNLANSIAKSRIGDLPVVINSARQPESINTDNSASLNAQCLNQLLLLRSNQAPQTSQLPLVNFTSSQGHLMPNTVLPFQNQQFNLAAGLSAGMTTAVQQSANVNNVSVSQQQPSNHPSIFVLTKLQCSSSPAANQINGNTQQR